MQHILYTMFLDDCISQLDDKYKELIKDELDKIYLYANILEIPSYYKLFVSKENKDYGLYKKLNSKKQIETIDLLKKEIIENNYCVEILLILYGYIAHIFFNYYLKDYVKGLIVCHHIKYNRKNIIKVTNNIAVKFYEEKFNKKINKYVVNKECLKLNDNITRIIKKILQELHLSSIGIKIYEISFENFILATTKTTIKNFSFRKLYYRIINKKFTKRKYSLSKKFKPRKKVSKVDYLNKNKDAWYLDDLVKVTSSFNELYERIMKEVLQTISLLNDEIFYKKKTKNSVIKQLNNIL